MVYNMIKKEKALRRMKKKTMLKNKCEENKLKDRKDKKDKIECIRMYVSKYI